MDVKNKEGIAEKKALELFHNAASRVPAYKDFLKRAKVNPTRVKTMADFASGVPIMDAKNYIAAYPIAKRCWDGKLSGAQLIATSSGTTGEPKFWPRGAEQDEEATHIHEWLYKMYFGIEKRSTLLLIGYPMGIYISGMATVLPSWLIAAIKKYSMTVMSIGNNKAEMLRAVRNLSASYDQTVLVGHPFFIKDVIETGADEGIAWSRANLGLMFCSEGFNEQWRAYVAKKARIPAGSMRIFNTYGSSEMLLMGYETPFTIAIKKMVEQNSHFLKILTGGTVPPQFFQYDPRLRYIESVNKELIFTSASGIPLIRFNLHDQGVVFPFRHVKKQLGIFRGESVDPLPVIALWGRSDQTVVFYAANIYPEHIKLGLNASTLFKKLTGKFTMRKDSTKNLDEFLEVNIELQPHVKPTHALEVNIRDTLVRQLQKNNLEYKFLREHLDKDIVPRIKLWPYNHEKYFKPGLKPRFIDRSSK